LVNGAGAFLSAEVGPADAGFEVIEDWAAAFQREAIQRGQSADGPEAVLGLLGYQGTATRATLRITTKA
jgi:hypothetical protein